MPRRVLKAALLSVVLVASAGAQAATVYITTMSGAQEAPPNASPAIGTARLIHDSVARTLRVTASFEGLTGTTTAAHIHVNDGPGDPTLGDSTGPVATPVSSFPGFPTGVISGSYDQTFDLSLATSYRPTFLAAAGGIAQAEAALIDGLNDGRAYFNIHTSLFGGGEIRGFFAVPEPGSLALLGAGLAFAAWRVRRRT